MREFESRRCQYFLLEFSIQENSKFFYLKYTNHWKYISSLAISDCSFTFFDYHPGSDEAVVDLVHPSLLVVQHNVTPIVMNGTLEVAKFFKITKYIFDNRFCYDSKRFQWLPTLLTKNSSGNFEFESYINNLHPILTRYASKEYVRIPIPHFEGIYTEEFHQQREALSLELEREAEETGVEYDWKRMEEFEKTRVQFLREFIPEWEGDPEFDKQIDLSTFDNLKVIVKLADIELTPERPAYPGGSWHIEGTENEDIVATVLYYYDIENIFDSRLSFRTLFNDPVYEQYDNIYTEVLFGLHDNDPIVKYLGNIEDKEDIVVIFPNILQHHVDPFELTDKTKPGHRRILCFFIVNPYNDRVLTTKQVPPQNKEWWDDTSLDYLFPNNLKEKILDLKNGETWPMNFAQAEDVRKVLMKERSMYEMPEDDVGITFSICEH
ncbi:hypothetical protein K6H10_000687 [Candida tropicalis]